MSCCYSFIGIMKLMKKHYLICLFLAMYSAVEAQSSYLMKGKVSIDGEPLENINVINRTQKRETKTKTDGTFALETSLDDELIFFNSNYQSVFHKITAIDLESLNLDIGMEMVITELKELVIEQKITTKSLGINAREIAINSVPHPTNMDFIAIIRRIGGEKEPQAMPKRWDDEDNLKLLIDAFPEDYLVKKLQIDPDMIGFFYYYLMGDRLFMDLLIEQNKEALIFSLIDKYQTFLAKMK